MKVTLELDKNLRFMGKDSRNHITYFDTTDKVGGDDSAPTPMEVLLQALGACTLMDVVSILRKKRKTVEGITLNIEGKRADSHPKVFTDIHLVYELKSPDAELKDLERSIELSEGTYCSISAMIKRSGCNLTWEAKMV
ncbi:MAG: OsmC family protein [Candidatus Kapabacteria bacterium]|nr:OsmC family protein [Candidatus Kapabacteria bacterium]